jgi:hypothetical protein
LLKYSIFEPFRSLVIFLLLSWFLFRYLLFDL